MSGLQKHLLNFADENMISAAGRAIEKLISIVENESQTAIDNGSNYMKWLSMMRNFRLL